MPSGMHAQLLAWLDERLDQIARESADVIFAEVPRYRQAADEQLYNDVVAHCRNVAGILVRSTREDREPTDRDYDWTSAQAVRRVSVGLEVTDFLRGFRLAQHTIWDTVQAAVREHPEWTQAALDMVDPIMRVYEMGSKVAVVAWLEAQRWQVAGDERLLADLLGDLLDGQVPTVPARRDALARAGLTEGAPFVVAVAEVTDHGRLPESMNPLSEVIRELSRVAGLFVAHHHEVYGIVPVPQDAAAVADELEAAARRLHGRGLDVRVGLSAAHSTLVDVPVAATLAARARELAGEFGVSRLGDMTLVDYLARQADDTALLMIDPRVRAVLAEDLAGHGQLVETVQAYARANLNAKEAAEDLAVHANTVYYRLERFGERAGCDLRRIDTLIDVLLAVRVLQDHPRGAAE